jgi:hypothetical protein
VSKAEHFPSLNIAPVVGATWNTPTRNFLTALHTVNATLLCLARPVVERLQVQQRRSSFCFGQAARISRGRTAAIDVILSRGSVFRVSPAATDARLEPRTSPYSNPRLPRVQRPLPVRYPLPLLSDHVCDRSNVCVDRKIETYRYTEGLRCIRSNRNVYVFTQVHDAQYSGRRSH